MKELLEQERLIDQEILEELEKYKMERELGGLELDDSSDLRFTANEQQEDFDLNESQIV